MLAARLVRPVPSLRADGWMGFCRGTAGDVSFSLSGLVYAVMAVTDTPAALLTGLLTGVRFACEQLAWLKEPFRRRCQGLHVQRVFSRCCQALLTAPGVWRMGFGSYIHKAERTWLTSIPPSSAQPAGLVSWCFWDLPCPDALQMPNPPGPRTIQPQAGCSMLPSPSCSAQEAKQGEDSPRGCTGSYRGWWSWLRPTHDGQN